VTVNGQPAQMLAGNTFEAYVNVPTTPTTVPVVATDTSGNATTKNYQVTGAGSAATYTYDANGNLTQKVEGSDTWTYEWNAENQLKRVLKNAVEQARFAYDALGRRVEKVAGGVTTSYAYDGEDIARDVTNAGAVGKHIHDDGIDRPLAREDGTGVLTFLHPDGSSSITRVTNAAGSILLSRRYDALGRLEVGNSDGFALMGREWDDAASLYYYRARFYDPSTARFISPDPIGFNGSRNFYVAFNNNPIRFADPRGLFAQINGCKDSVRDKISAAGAAAVDAAYRCLPCEEASEFENVYKRVTVKCLTSSFDPQRQKWLCGAIENVNGFNITPDGYNEIPACRCLGVTIFHEILHMLPFHIRYDDKKNGDRPAAEDRARECVSCASGPGGS